MTLISSPKRKLLLAAGYLVAYVLLAWLCYARPLLAPGITPWHPQAGLTLAFLVVAGPAWCAVTAIAAVVSELVIRGEPGSVLALSASSVWIAVVYGTFATLLRHLLPHPLIRTTADAAKFAGVGGVASLVAAAGYVGTFVATSDVAIADVWRGGARYWFADLNGILMLTPLLLLDGERRRAGWRALRARHLEALAQFALVLGLLWIIFRLPVDEQLRFFYLLFVPVIWIALRWNWSGALTAVLVIQSVLIFAAETDLHTPRFIDLQFLMLTLGVTALLLGAVVAERRRSEVTLRERDATLSSAMRFAVAGELASTLAHELNQPITALVSYLNAAQILAAPRAADERLHTTLQKATNEAIRASEVMHRLRNLYIGGRSRRELVDLHALCEAVAAGLADRLRATDTKLELIADSPLPKIEADATQLEIVLHNLVANAIDATEQSQRLDRRIEIRLGAGTQVFTITIEDTGPGFSAEVAPQLFEPFFTSKSSGMGLGLAISRSLVRARGGEIVAEASTSLGGARFQVTLPFAPPLDEDAS